VLRGALSFFPILLAADTHHHILYGVGDLKSSTRHR
jgi:hypothetical protein